MRKSGLLLFVSFFPYPSHNPLPDMCLRNACSGQCPRCDVNGTWGARRSHKKRAVRHIHVKKKRISHSILSSHTEMQYLPILERIPHNASEYSFQKESEEDLTNLEQIHFRDLQHMSFRPGPYWSTKSVCSNPPPPTTSSRSPKYFLSFRDEEVQLRSDTCLQIT
jgi:hypothetical protein